MDADEIEKLGADIPTAPDEHKRRMEVVACFGMAAASLASVLTLLGVPTLDNALTTALYCFAISLPANAFYGFAFHAMEPMHDRIAESSFLSYTFMLLMVIPAIGFMALILHFSTGAAVIFAIVSISMPVVAVIAMVTGALKKAKKEKELNTDNRAG